MVVIVKPGQLQVAEKVRATDSERFVMAGGLQPRNPAIELSRLENVTTGAHYSIRS